MSATICSCQIHWLMVMTHEFSAAWPKRGTLAKSNMVVVTYSLTYFSRCVSLKFSTCDSWCCIADIALVWSVGTLCNTSWCCLTAIPNNPLVCFKKMSCGVSVFSVRGTNIWNEMLIMDALRNKGLPVNYSQIEELRKISGRACKKSGGRREAGELRNKPRAAVPLHRSRAVFKALAQMSQERTAAHSDEEGATAEVDSRPTVVSPGSEKTPPADHHSESRKASSALRSRGANRMRPYERRPLHVALGKGKTEELRSCQTWPNDLIDCVKPQETHSISKSFSSPDRLYMHDAPQSSSTVPCISGGQLSAFAIQNLSKVCMKTLETNVTFSSNVSFQNAAITSSSQGLKLRPTSSFKKMDNFRKLLCSRVDGSVPILSSVDVALQRNIRDALATYGICVIQGLLGNDLARQIREEAVSLHGGSGVVEGGLIGKGENESKTRGDLITWVSGTEPNCPTIGHLCQKMDRVVSLEAGVAPAYNVCGGTKAMVARYPGGGTRYKMHVDNATKDGRCLTCIYYLNEDWDSNTMGGTLRIHAQTSKKTAFIEPKMDRLAVFYSDCRNPHEVLPCYANRYAITLWYFDRNERIEALKRMDSSAPSTLREKAGK